MSSSRRSQRNVRPNASESEPNIDTNVERLDTDTRAEIGNTTITRRNGTNPEDGAGSSAPRPTMPRGRVSTAKGLKFQPKAVTRRSKEEREAQERIEADKKKAADAVAARSAPRGGRGSREFSRGGFQGGMSGWSNRGGPRLAGAASGVMGGPSVKDSYVGSYRRPVGPGISRSITETPRIKSEATESNNFGSRTFGSSGGGRTRDEVKSEDRPLSIYEVGQQSDEEEEPRVNVDNIEVITISDDDNVAQPELKPVRLDRVDHEERAVGANTGSEQKSKTPAEDAGDDEVEKVEEDRTHRQKTEEPGKQVARPFRGVYQDEDDVKPDVMDLDAEHDTTTSKKTGKKAITSSDEPQIKESSSPKAQRQQKPNPRMAVKPVFQSAEDAEEWERREEDVKALVEEIGSLMRPSTTDVTDNDGQSSPTDIEELDRRRGLVYLFQLPPVLPAICKQQQQQSADELQPPMAEEITISKSKSTSNTRAPDVTVKTEHAEVTAVDPLPVPFLTAEIDDEVDGLVGHLTMYESGATYLTWGGLEYEVHRGADGELLQQVVVSDLKSISSITHADAMHGAKQERHRANCMGTLAGGFVCTPNWDKLLNA
jgi:DNA-directed RNA polymerase III subunit RPC4